MSKKRNKILALFTDVYKSKGGIPVFNQNLLKALSEIYHGRIIVFSINDVLKENSGHYYFEGCDRRKVRFVFKTLLISIINKPDFIICGHVNISPLCLLIKKALGVPYITVTHGIDAWDVKSIKKRKGLESSDIIVSVSNYTKVRIKEQFGLKEDKFFILPDAVDGTKFKPKPKPEYLIKRYGVEDRTVILTVCRLDKSEAYKGYDKIIEALPKIIKKIPNLVYLIGGKGNDASRIERLIKDRGLDDYIKLIGFIPEKELVDHYNLCDVFVMPSKGEGFGIVFLEALACGKPVICGNKDGSVDAVLNGKLGILVDPDNIDQIAEAIINVLQGNVPHHLLDPEYLRETVLEHYGFDKLTKRAKDLLNRVEDEL